MICSISKGNIYNNIIIGNSTYATFDRIIDNLVNAINAHIEASEQLIVEVVVKYLVEDSIFSVEFADNDKKFRTATTQSYSYGEYVHHDLKVGRLNSLR